MASVYFKCACNQNLALDAADAGRQVQCPDCGRTLSVPSPELYWKCACGEEMAAPGNLAGAVLLCAACKAEHTVPVRLQLSARSRSARGGKADQPRPTEMAADVPRVPVGKAGNVECPKCGYLFAAVLALCPRCQHQRRKGRVILRQGLRVAQVVLIIVLGWLLAANFERLSELGQGLSEYVKALFNRMLE